jgi:hypothetical protein
MKLSIHLKAFTTEVTETTEVLKGFFSVTFVVSVVKGAV